MTFRQEHLTIFNEHRTLKRLQEEYSACIYDAFLECYKLLFNYLFMIQHLP